ncbi:MAG: vWA domain-containing protein [Hyphomicrobiaceae bacterium]
MRSHLSLALGGAAVMAAFGASSAPAKEAVEIDARLGQRILKERTTQRVYIRIGLKGARSERAETRTPVNVALVIDRSGSMAGDKIVKAREAAMMAIDRLSPRDIASVVIFDDRIDVLVPATRVTDHGMFKDRIARGVTARGSTAIYSAVEEGARELRKFKASDRVNRVILMSDGLANVGPSRPVDFAELGRRLGSEGIAVTTIGLGRDYNEDLMARLAGASDGNHAYARTGSDLVEFFNREFDDVLSVSAQDIEIIIETRAGIRVLRSLGRDAEILPDRARMQLNQVYSSGEHSLQFEMEIPAEVASGEIELARVKVSYSAGGTGGRHTVETTVRARFSTNDEEVRRSIDPIVIEPILELGARSRSARAIELRDQGKLDEARKELEENAATLAREMETYGVQSSERLKAAREQSRKDADEVVSGDWQSQRKVMKQNLQNAPSAPSRY